MKLGHRYLTAAVIASTIGLQCSMFAVGATSSKVSTAVKPLRATALSRTMQPAFGEKKIFRGKITKDIQDGEKLLLSGKYSQAQETFRQSLNQNSRSIPALCGLGFALAMQFKLDAAEQQFGKALKLDANDPLGHVGMAYVKLNRLQSSNMSVIKQRNAILTEAQSECQLALQAEPNMPEALLVQGLVQKEQGNLVAAKDSLTRSIDADPQFSVAFVNRGLIEMQQGETAAAIADYQQAIQLRSSNSAAHYALGVAYTQLGQLDQAYKELNTSLSLNNNSAPAHTAMGEVYRLQGNSVAAIKEYKAAIAIKPENTAPYLKLADIYQGRGDLEFAAAQLNSGLAINPGDTALLLRLGDISLQLGKLDDGIKDYTTVLAQTPNNVEAVNGMTRGLVLKSEKEAAGAYFISNNFESAERLIQRAISMNPNNLQLRLADAKLRALAGQPVNFETVGTPTNDAERIAFAEAALAQCKFDEAKQAMATVIQNCQTAPDCFAVADMALMTRDLDSAEAAYNKGGTFGNPDYQSRSRRGLAAVSTARTKAQQDLTMAKDFTNRSQFSSAIDKYRSAAYLNPRLADAHLGLAEVLDKFQKNNSTSLREATQHIKAYLTLSPNLPEKERNKLQKKAEKNLEVAAKIDQGHPPSKLSSIFSPVGNLGRKIGTELKGAFE